MKTTSIRARYRLGASGWSFLAFLLGPIAMLVALLGGEAWASQPLVPVLSLFGSPLAYVLAAWLSSLSIEVGADGFVAKRRGGFARYVPYETIESVRLADGWLTVRLRDGSETTYSGIANPYSRRGEGPAASLASVVFQEIEEARAAFARREAGERAPGARLYDEALAALRSERSSTEYRDAVATDVATLERVLADPHADERARGAAAVLLRVQAPERAKLRIAEATEQTASPHVKALLEAAAEAEDGQLAEVLERATKRE